MAKKTERTLKLSAQGIEKANTALTKFGSVADLAAQIGAARKRTKGASPKTTVGMSRGTIYKFLNGEPVQRKEFHEICKKLGLKWQDIVDLPGINQPESAEKEQEQGTDIDELVREVRSRLRNDIERLHGRIPLYGVDGLVPLGDLFVNVNILKQRSSSRKSELDDLWEDFLSGGQDAYGYRSFDRMGLGKNLQPVAGDKVLEKGTNLMVVGKPGAGKTTYLQHIVIKCNDNEGLLQPHRIPVLIKLRDFVKDGRRFEYCLKHYLCWQWGLSEDNTESVLGNGRTLILLDGLDEVTGTDGQAIAEKIEYFARTYPQNQLVVTSRTQCQTVGFGQFEYVEVDNFNKAQVQDFAYRWFEAIAYSTQEGQEKAKQFLDQLYLPKHHQICELAITPILLSLTCSVFYYRGKFYSQRTKLYQEAIELLLDKWDKDRKIERDEIYRELPPERKQQLLCYLAATNFTKPKYYILFEQDEIEDCIASYLNCSRQDSKAVLRAMEKQHGLLIERAQGFWSFSHLTFQEYFAAKWFCDCADWHGFVEHITDKHWREVFLLTVEMLPNPDFLLQLMKRKVDALVANDEILQRFLIWINNKSSSVNVTYKPVAIRFFYLFLSLDIHYATGLFDEFGWVPLVPPPMRHLDHNFDKVVDPDLALAFTLKLAHDIDQSYRIALAEFHDEEKAEFAVSKYTDTLKYALVREFEPEIKTAIKPLKEQLGYSLKENKFMGWWQVNGQAWTEKLRDVLIQYHNFHEFNFNDTQKHLLQQYYDANKLLVDCLKSRCAVSPTVKQEIEDTLLWQEPSATESVAEVADE